jgi:hydrogenase maturation protease
MNGSAENSPAPVLVLGLGNLLLGDDALGLRLLAGLSSSCSFGDAVDFVDGGTQGLALLGALDHRSAILVLDAVKLGCAPGTVYVLDEREIEEFGARHAATAHEGNALELFATAKLLGAHWHELRLVGIEPEHVATGIGLSPAVEKALPLALYDARQLVQGMVHSNVSCCSG